MSAIVMWWRRRPEGSMGIPAPRVAEFRIGMGLKAAMVVLAVALPMLGISIVMLWITQRISHLFSPAEVKT
jgi:uncharacterized iron-regulated membrane protein